MSVDMNSQASDSNEEDFGVNSEEEEDEDDGGEEEDQGDIAGYYEGVASDVEQQGADSFDPEEYMFTCLTYKESQRVLIEEVNTVATALKRAPCSSHGKVCVSPALVAQRRNNSTSSPKIKVDFDQSTGVAVLRMQSPPVNSLSLDFLTEFCISVEKLEMDKSCRGLIITSSQPKVFSAGLDITEMYGKSLERYGEFWRAVQEMWLKLYSSNMVTIAAINGSSPAGGCLMSLACDYRIMADGPRYSIGLNETQLGIVAPFWFKDTLTNTVGHRTAELALALGLLYNPAEALKIGMVDQLVPEDQVLTTATQTMAKWLVIPDHARQITKSMMRKPTIDKLVSKREADIQNFVGFISKDSIQKSLGMYMEMLKKRRG